MSPERAGVAPGRAVQALRAGRRWVPRPRATFPWTAPPVPRGVEVPAQPRKVGADFETEWARSDAARFARALLLEGPLRLGVQALARPEVHGRDRLADLRAVRPVTPVIFAANHHSHLDTPLLLTALPEPWRHRTVVGAAADYFFGTRVTGTLSALALNAIPIERTRVNRRSADLAGSLVDDGWSLLIFPEGGRSPDGWGQPFRGGAAFLSVRTGAPVIPVHIEGTGAILGKGMNRPKRGRAVVTFGAPLRPDAGEDARRFTVRIERAVNALGDESSSDWWTARQRAARQESPVLSGPDLGSWRRAWALGDSRGRGLRRRPARPRWPDLG